MRMLMDCMTDPWCHRRRMMLLTGLTFMALC